MFHAFRDFDSQPCNKPANATHHGIQRASGKENEAVARCRSRNISPTSCTASSVQALGCGLSPSMKVTAARPSELCPDPTARGSTREADRFKVAEQGEHAVTPGSPLTEDDAVQTMYRRGGSAFKGDVFRRRHGTSIPDCRCVKKLTYAGGPPAASSRRVGQGLPVDSGRWCVPWRLGSMPCQQP